MYASAILTSSGYKPNNANPKASLAPSAVQGKVPDHVFQRYQRAENAQSNNMEQMPLFVAAVLASVFAERSSFKGAGISVTGGDPTGVGSFVMAWFAVRAAYCVAYVTIGDHPKSLIRSALWAVGSGLAMWQIYKAAQILG